MASIFADYGIFHIGMAVTFGILGQILDNWSLFSEAYLLGI